ncbi:MAG: tRNA 2-thiouridine(34) synthase MnmA [Planctomycetota bacterium]
MRILCAMSGGVDSSVAALRLLAMGHEVVGVFMRNGVTSQGDVEANKDSPGEKIAKAKSCCSASDARDAAVVAERLGVPFFAVDYAAEFGAIIDHFADEYRRGRTPNPCVLCNSRLKFGHLLELADELGADGVATGHYARIENGRMLTAVDPDKDQTYYLFGIGRAALERAHFPLGDSTKAQIRAEAAAAGLRTANKPESMEICFVTSGDYRDVVRARGGLGNAGRFVDLAGRELGAHGGVAHFTVGQRRGLPALGAPHYVHSIRPAAGEVVLAVAEDLDCRSALVRGVSWLSDLPEPDSAGAIPVTCKVRARHEGTPARLSLDPTRPELVQVAFDDPVRAITPGQAAVFYAGEVVLGGGWID